MRKHYIDWLRNLGILYLFPFHTARLFDSMEPNYIKGETSLLCDLLIQASMWFMPLLFLISGMSTYYSLKKRSNRQYIRERISRLLVPFIFGLLFIVPPQAYNAEKFHN
jgi:glucan biosynthesis protein C